MKMETNTALFTRLIIKKMSEQAKFFEDEENQIQFDDDLSEFRKHMNKEFNDFDWVNNSMQIMSCVHGAIVNGFLKGQSAKEILFDVLGNFDPRSTK